VTLPDGRQGTYSTRDVLHIRAPLTLDGVRGLAPLAAAREAISSARSLATFTSRTFENDARPSGILRVPPGPTADDQMEALEDAWATKYQGPERAGRIAVLSGEVSFEALSIPARDLEFVEQRKLSTAEVARIFRLPPWILGAPSGDSLTYSNTAEQMRAFVAFGLRPKPMRACATDAAPK
jgi:HK97 family phage portal protein